MSKGSIRKLRLLQHVVNRAVEYVTTSLRQEFSAAIAEWIVSWLNQRTSELQKKHQANPEHQPLSSALPPMILPRNTRFVIERGKLMAIGVEQPPQLRTLTFGFAEKHVVALSFPRILFVVNLKEGRYFRLYAYFLDGEFRTYEQAIYKINLPNTFASGQFCMSFTAPPELSPMQMVEWGIDMFWRSKFGSVEDLTTFQSTKWAVDDRVATRSRWAAESRKDKNFVLSVKWPLHNKPLIYYLAEMLNEDTLTQIALRSVLDELRRDINLRLPAELEEQINSLQQPSLSQEEVLQIWKRPPLTE